MAGICNLLCLAVITLFTIVTANDYCTMQTYACKVKGSHTMCQYPLTTPAVTCGKCNTGLTEADKKAVLNKHNELRQKVASGKENGGNPGPQPPATRMPNLIWDDELAIVAQRWANQCNFSHDKCRDVKRFVVGQNIAQSYYTGENKSTWESFVQSWYDEVAYFNNTKVQKYKFEKKIGHYSQVVWANTKRVGCGATQFNSDGRNVKHLVCNYGPSGNWQSEEMYPTKK